MVLRMPKDEVISIIHGSGGAVMEEFIQKNIIRYFTLRRVLNGIGLDAFDDGASMKIDGHEIVVTTDAHTVDPIFFPGGDIGSLAISGTINDVAVMGAKPVAILDTIVVEEGFKVSDLQQILNSMNKVAEEVDVAIIAGDFKVMPQGKLDKIVISTTGIGILQTRNPILDSGAKPGDKVIVTGTIGEHGIALLSAREGLEFETKIVSDVAPIWDVVEAALKIGGIHAMKDPTRGGIVQAIYEIAEKSSVGIWLDEEKIPIKDAVVAACEMLGIDPLELICEGRAIIVTDANTAEDVLNAIRKTKHGKDAAIIGEVRKEHPGKVFLRTEIGSTRFLEKPLGDPLPRIC